MKKIGLLFVIFLVGCKVVPNIPYNPEWNVFFVLKDSGKNCIVLDRTHKMEEDNLPIDTIHLTLWDDEGDTLKLTFDSLGIYGLNSVFIRHGAHYYMKLYERHLGELTGKMQMPDSFSVLLPGDTLSPNTIIAIRCGSVSRFIVYVASLSTEVDRVFMTDEVDTNIVFIPLFPLASLPEGEYKFIIQALDQNYADYIFFSNDSINVTRQSYGIDNGVGVFGGLSQKILKVYLR